MKTSSAKNKGRKLQQWVRDKMLKAANLEPDDIFSRSMGAGGTDIMLSTKGLSVYPWAIECKNSERINVWSAYKQACSHKNYPDQEPVLIIKCNNHRPLAVVDAEYFIDTEASVTRVSP